MPVLCLGIHMYQFTFEPLCFCFRLWYRCVFGFEQKFWQIDGFVEKRHGSVDLHAPIIPQVESHYTTRTAQCLVCSTKFKVQLHPQAITLFQSELFTNYTVADLDLQLRGGLIYLPCWLFSLWSFLLFYPK